MGVLPAGLISKSKAHLKEQCGQKKSYPRSIFGFGVSAWNDIGEGTAVFAVIRNAFTGTRKCEKITGTHIEAIRSHFYQNGMKPTQRSEIAKIGQISRILNRFFGNFFQNGHKETHTGYFATQTNLYDNPRCPTLRLNTLGGPPSRFNIKVQSTFKRTMWAKKKLSEVNIWVRGFGLE